jgi:hypothetical protein
MNKLEAKLTWLYDNRHLFVVISDYIRDYKVDPKSIFYFLIRSRTEGQQKIDRGISSEFTERIIMSDYDEFVEYFTEHAKIIHGVLDRWGIFGASYYGSRFAQEVHKKDLDNIRDCFIELGILKKKRRPPRSSRLTSEDTKGFKRRLED